MGHWRFHLVVCHCGIVAVVTPLVSVLRLYATCFALGGSDCADGVQVWSSGGHHAAACTDRALAAGAQHPGILIITAGALGRGAAIFALEIQLQRMLERGNECFIKYLSIGLGFFLRHPSE